jgi:hypothetical protein
MAKGELRDVLPGPGADVGQVMSAHEEFDVFDGVRAV